MASGASWWPAAIIVVTALAALAFTLGWRTRLANLVLFVAVGSMQSRQPLILIGGDILIMALLFWCLLLPAGARWSADAALSSTPPRRHRYRSLAAFGLLVQVVSVYFFSAVLKHGDAWWPDGTGGVLRAGAGSLHHRYWPMAAAMADAHTQPELRRLRPGVVGAALGLRPRCDLSVAAARLHSAHGHAYWFSAVPGVGALPLGQHGVA